jgi:hypothetical protein
VVTASPFLFPNLASQHPQLHPFLAGELAQSEGEDKSAAANKETTTQRQVQGGGRRIARVTDGKERLASVVRDVQNKMK